LGSFSIAGRSAGPTVTDLAKVGVAQARKKPRINTFFIRISHGVQFKFAGPKLIQRDEKLGAGIARNQFREIISFGMKLRLSYGLQFLPRRMDSSFPNKKPARKFSMLTIFEILKYFAKIH
jgi:hypothetical protein